MRYSEIYLRDLKLNIDNIVRKELLYNKKIVITGASGLIGSAVADVLLMYNEVYHAGITLYLAGRSKDRIKERFCYWGSDKYIFVRYDALENLGWNFTVDYVIHCASNAHPVAYVEQPVETLMTSVVGTNNLLEYCKENAVKMLLYVSSSEVYGNKENKNPYKEEDSFAVDILNPRACYPSGKRAAETLCASYKKEHGVDFVIVRPGHVYGPCITEQDSRAHAQFLRDVLNNRDIVMKSAGLQLRSYCHAFDCVTAMLSVLTSGNSGEAYNISNKDSVVTIREFAEMHAKLANKEVIFENPDDREIAGYNMMSNSALDSEKLYELKWEGLYSLEAGVRETINVFKTL